MTQPGLNLVAPDLVIFLQARDDEGRRRAAIAAACYALESTDLIDNSTVRAALTALDNGATGHTSEAYAVGQLTKQLDEVAWELQAESEAGRASHDDYLRAFMRARAAASLRFAFEPDSSTAANEAIYEAHHATQNLQQLRAIVNVR